MGHGAWMKIAWGTWKMGGWGWNITPERLHVSVGYVWGAWATSASKGALDRLPKLDMFRWVVGFEVLVLSSCLMVRNFRPVEMSAGPSLKHDMFSCRFASGPPLHVRGNPHQVTLKQMMHFWLVAEITSRDAQYVSPDSKVYSENVIMCGFSLGNLVFLHQIRQLAVAGKRCNTVVHLHKRV